MASVPMRKREPNKYLRACVPFIKKTFLGRERLTRRRLLHVYQQLKSAGRQASLSEEVVSAILMPDRHAVGRLEVTDFLEA